MKHKHPYAVMKAAADKISAALAPHCERIEVAGSLRRKCDLVGDIEIVCIPKPFDTGMFESGFASVVNTWEKIKGEVTGKYTQRRTDEGIVLDIFIAEPGNWGYILAIRTGSAEYSHQVLAKGWRAVGLKGEDGYLYRNGQKVEVPEEADLFRLIGIPFAKPEERNM